jgi:uncharacterized protein YjiS (DUF1127 family)
MLRAGTKRSGVTGPVRSPIFPVMTQNNPRALAATLWPRISFARREGWFYLCWQRNRQRRALEGLNDHQLRDIGLTREQVRVEVVRPPWR